MIRNIFLELGATGQPETEAYLVVELCMLRDTVHRPPP